MHTLHGKTLCRTMCYQLFTFVAVAKLSESLSGHAEPTRSRFMFQDFAQSADPTVGAERTRRLGRLAADLGLAAIAVPRADEHMGEYVPSSSDRLKWVTGFTGSAGLAIIGPELAALFVDGRYTLQARDQVDTSLFEIHQIPDVSPMDWVAKRLAAGATVGYDPWLHSSAWVKTTSASFAQQKIVLKALSRNPVDQVWGKERPAPPVGTVIVHPIAYAGKAVADKLAEVRQTLKADGQ